MSSPALVAALVILATAIRAAFVAGEAALIGVSPERARALHRERDSLSSRSLLLLEQDVETSFAATRAGSLLGLALGAAAIGVALVEETRLLDQLHEPLAFAIAIVAGALGAALCCLFLDTIPRSLAIANPEGWALRVAVPLRAIAFFLRPLERSFRALLDKLLSPLGVRVTFKAADPAIEDIERILAEEALGDEDVPEPGLVHSLFEFPSLTVRDVMVPRTQVSAIPLHIQPDALVELLAVKGHSRYPVYDGHIDRIVGILHTRDVVPLLAHPELIKLMDAIRPPVFVPWAKRVGRLLREMQHERLHMVMVTDEHGGFMGVVTLEDILEELVGKLPDNERGGSTNALDIAADGGRLIQAGISMDNLNELFGTELPERPQYGTLAGFLNHLAGEIPAVGTTLESHGLSFTVAERGPTKVVKVWVAPAQALGVALPHRSAP